jgi:predicted dithiol-disulfide oxidoreductase (DUF899 family)
MPTTKKSPALKKHPVVSHQEWITARKAFLKKEKKFAKLRDALSAERRALPWEKVEKEYFFAGPNGQESLADLFAGKSQLIVYHFMFGPDWTEGCKGCSFWADNFNGPGIGLHLKNRDTTILAISRAPLARLKAFQKRMKWSFKWVSSLNNDFNFDYGVSFKPEDAKDGKIAYKYALKESDADEMPGISVFFRDAKGAIFHTYSTYARGLDMTNTVYQYLDLTPKGRDEDALEWPMQWVRHHDRYAD